MEENTVELFDYLRVIWKRKILIIVGTLVCIGVGVGVGVTSSKSRQKLPVIYRADAVIKIGKTVKLVLSSGMSSSVVEYIEEPGPLVETIPLLYAFKVKDASGYQFYAEQINALHMLKLNLNGPDKGVGKVLKEIVDMLVNEHRMMAKDSVVIYKNFMSRLKVEAENLEEEIIVLDARVKEMKSKEGKYLVNDIESSRSTKEEMAGKGYRSAFLNMLYLKTIDREKDLNKSRAELRNIQRELVVHKIILGNLEEYKTEMVGTIVSTVVESKEKKKGVKHKIMIAGVIGLIMSLFIAFFMEYIEESKPKRNENGKVDLA